MEQTEQLIMEKAPPDTSIYEEGKPAETDRIPEEEYGNYSFSDMIKEATINE